MRVNGKDASSYNTKGAIFSLPELMVSMTVGLLLLAAFFLSMVSQGVQATTIFTMITEAVEP